MIVYLRLKRKLVFYLIEIAECILHFKALIDRKTKHRFFIQPNKKVANLSLTDDDVPCPWLDVDELFVLLLLLFDGILPPGKLVKRFIGDVEFCIVETIVDDDLLKSSKKNIDSIG